MPADQFLPAPTLTGDDPGVSMLRAARQQRGPIGGAGASLTQAGAPAPSLRVGPTVAYGTSVRSRASSPATTTEGTNTMRRITRTIQHLIAGRLASQKVARANAGTASVTLTAQREEREGVEAYLGAHIIAPPGRRGLRATMSGCVPKTLGTGSL